MRPLQRQVISFLKETANVADVKIEPGGKHPKVRYRYEDRILVYVMPFSSGDGDVFWHVRAGLRRQMRGLPG